MLAKAATALPDGDGFCYEPKWDGFRAIVFRSDDDVYIQSRDLKPLDRYFPELHDALAGRPARRLRRRRRDRDRDARTGSTSTPCRCGCIRPRRASQKLAGEMPASFVAFDLLAADNEDLRNRPLSERRARLEQISAAMTRGPASARSTSRR